MFNPLRSLGALLGIGAAADGTIKIPDDLLDSYLRGPKTPRQRRARAKAKRAKKARQKQRQLARARR